MVKFLTSERIKDFIIKWNNVSVLREYKKLDYFIDKKKQIDCNNCKAVSFDEFTRYLKSRSDHPKRSVMSFNCEKNEIPKHCWEVDHNFCWDQRKVINRENKLIPRKIKEAIYFWGNPNHINKISYMLLEI